MGSAFFAVLMAVLLVASLGWVRRARDVRGELSRGAFFLIALACLAGIVAIFNGWAYVIAFAVLAVGFVVYWVHDDRAHRRPAA